MCKIGKLSNLSHSIGPGAGCNLEGCTGTDSRLNFLSTETIGGTVGDEKGHTGRRKMTGYNALIVMVSWRHSYTQLIKL